jgi:phospholipid/cholesterol/gamma-HCH transport system substrate-binding protein
MDSTRALGGLHPIRWALISLLVLALSVWLCGALFLGTFRSFVPVTLTSDRAGLVMESGGKVKMRGVEVGRVATVRGGTDQVSLKLEIYPEQIKYIPANVQARIRATTAFGAKYVDLIPPNDPTAQRLSPGEVIRSQNVSTEINSVFQNLTDILHKVDPAKLNGVLTALAEGLRGQGQAIGQATTDANHVFSELNTRAAIIDQDWRSLKGFSDTYSFAAQDILSVLDAASTTSTTIVSGASALDHLLLNVVGLSRSGVALLAPSKDNLVTGINAFESTTRLLMKYNPELTCTLVGAKLLLDPESVGGYDAFGTTGGSNGKSQIMDAALLPGKDPYKYPDNLPITAAKGGPGGKPSCGSLPDVSKNFPQRYLVTNTGWGTGLDMRPNPGIAFPMWANFLPATRAVPEPPSLRNDGGGPAPGPIPYPGAPPYGAPMYGPDGAPLYPGEPPAPPPGAPREPGPTPGSEPFVVPNPMQLQPTPKPPLPEQAAPSP